MTYILLLLTILLIWAIAYPLTDYALLSPPSLILLMFAFATLLALIGCAYWNQVSLSTEAYFIVTVGCIGVLAAAFIAKNLFRANESASVRQKAIQAIEHIARISQKRWLGLAGFVVIAAAINIGEMVALAQNAGYVGSSFMDIAQWARGNISSLLTSGSTDGDESYSTLSSALNKLIMFCGYAAVIGLAAKIRIAERGRGASDYAGIVLLFLVAAGFSLMKGGRDTIAHYIVAFLVALFAFYLLTSHDRNKTSLKFFKIGVVFVVVAIPLFYLALELVGRTRSVSLFDYTSFYFGGGLPSLSYALESFPTNVSEAFSGERTFTQLYAALSKIGLIGPVDAYADTFIKLDGHSSNIFTCFYRYYVDFGYVGVFLLSCLATLVFCWCFDLLTKSPSVAVKIVAVYVCSYAADVAREEFIFSRLLSASLLWAIIASVIIGFALTYRRQKKASVRNDRVGVGDTTEASLE